MLKWVEGPPDDRPVRVVLPPLGPSVGVTELGVPIHLLWGSAQRELIARKRGTYEGLCV